MAIHFEPSFIKKSLEATIPDDIKEKYGQPFLIKTDTNPDIFATEKRICMHIEACLNNPKIAKMCADRKNRKRKFFGGYNADIAHLNASDKCSNQVLTDTNSLEEEYEV